MKILTTILIPLLLLLLASGCIEQIDFESPETEGLLVVDGVLSTQAESNEIKLIRTDVLGKTRFPTENGATITIYDQNNVSAEYIQVGDGEYILPEELLKPRIGNTYHIQIVTSDGKRYESSKETIVSSPVVDSISFQPIIEYILVDETRNLERRFLDVYAYTTMPSDGNPPYLKWDVEHVYLQPEISCGPLHTPVTCYVEREINQNKVLVLDGNIISKGSDYREMIAHVEIDFAFGLAAAFYVKQTSLSQAAYEYWNNINQIVNEAGSIFGAPPAGVLGNIKNVDDPEEVVLGYFSAVDESSKAIIITRGDLGEKFVELPLCGIPGFEPNPLDVACCSCLSVPNSTLDRPFFWP